MAVRVGSDIQFDRRQMIGWGPSGTVVLRGSFKGGQQPVAVKRFITKQLRWNANEFQLYRNEHHANILRIHHLECDHLSGFTYFALELGTCNLAGYLAGKYRGPPLSAHTILLQISQGLQHLHSLGVIHRGLKPNNVLICTETQTNPQLVKQVQIKLSDFGVMAGSSSGDSWPCSDRDSVEGWLAPEQIKTLGLSARAVTTTTAEAGSTLQRQKSGAQLQLLTPAVDVFALGCLFFCVLTSGQHPFGSPSYFRDQRALACQYELAPLSLQLPPAAILIERMIQRDPDYRPTIDNVLAQSNFWSLDI